MASSEGANGAGQEGVYRILSAVRAEGIETAYLCMLQEGGKKVKVCTPFPSRETQQTSFEVDRSRGDGDHIAWTDLLGLHCIQSCSCRKLTE